MFVLVLCRKIENVMKILKIRRRSWLQNHLLVLLSFQNCPSVSLGEYLLLRSASECQSGSGIHPWLSCINADSKIFTGYIIDTSVVMCTVSDFCHLFPPGSVYSMYLAPFLSWTVLGTLFLQDFYTAMFPIYGLLLHLYHYLCKVFPNILF